MEGSNLWIANWWVVVPVKPSELMSMGWRLTFGDSGRPQAGAAELACLATAQLRR